MAVPSPTGDGYLVRTMTVANMAMESVFDADYIHPDFRDLKVSIEFPAERQAYPSIWTDFEPTGPLQTAGIGHQELGDPTEEGGDERLFTRWRFSGSITYTAVALSSLQRSRLVDEMVRVLAFGLEHDTTAVFRQTIEDNDHIGMNANFDEIDQRGFSATPGTPWGTDDVVYEATLALGVVGEFVSNGLGIIVPLSAVEVYAYAEGEPDPVPGGGGWQ